MIDLEAICIGLSRGDLPQIESPPSISRAGAAIPSRPPISRKTSRCTGALPTGLSKPSGRGGLEHAVLMGLMDVLDRIIVESTECGVPDALGVDAINRMRVALNDVA